LKKIIKWILSIFSIGSIIGILKYLEISPNDIKEFFLLNIINIFNFFKLNYWGGFILGIITIIILITLTLLIGYIISKLDNKSNHIENINPIYKSIWYKYDNIIYEFSIINNNIDLDNLKKRCIKCESLLINGNFCKDCNEHYTVNFNSSNYYVRECIEVEVDKYINKKENKLIFK
jgi:hypothetical protein